MTAKKIPAIDTITLNWCEGTIALSEGLQGKKVKTVLEFNRILARIKADNHGLGYNKTNLTVLLDDGTEWTTRFDIGSDDVADLEHHLKGLIRYYSNANAPEYVTKDAPEAMAVLCPVLDAIVANSAAPCEETARLEAFLGL